MAIAGSLSSAKDAPTGPCFGRTITANAATPFIERVWLKRRWERGSPGHLALRSWRKKLRCAAGPGHRKALKSRWREAKSDYYQFRWRKRHPWEYAWNQLSETDQQWAISTGECESGNVATTDTGNGFLGAFQWILATWQAAGGSGSPTEASWYEQAVRAVHWRNVAGASQWPVCGV